MGFVRVRIPESGAHVTVSEEWAEASGLKPLKEDALDHLGRPREATTKDGEPYQAPAAADAATNRGGAAPNAEEAPK